MPFRLTNAPTMFMDLMNWVFRPYLDQYSGIHQGSREAWETFKDSAIDLNEKSIVCKVG
jgi:hypothetical protein